MANRRSRLLTIFTICTLLAMPAFSASDAGSGDRSRHAAAPNGAAAYGWIAAILQSFGFDRTLREARSQQTATKAGPRRFSGEIDPSGGIKSDPPRRFCGDLDPDGCAKN